jgi:hypothetical protein
MQSIILSSAALLLLVIFITNRSAAFLKQRAIKKRARDVQLKINKRLKMSVDKSLSGDGRNIVVNVINDPWESNKQDSKKFMKYNSLMEKITNGQIG